MAPPRLYPFHTLAVGEYFDWPRDLGRRSDGGDARQNAIRTAANRWTRRNAPEMTLDVRCVDARTVRCKRTA